MVPKTRGIEPRDTNLYDLLPKAINIFAPNEWSYFIVNRSDADDDERVNEFQSDIRNRNIVVRRMIASKCLETRRGALGVRSNFERHYREPATVR